MISTYNIYGKLCTVIGFNEFGYKEIVLTNTRL